MLDVPIDPSGSGSGGSVIPGVVNPAIAIDAAFEFSTPSAPEAVAAAAAALTAAAAAAAIDAGECVAGGVVAFPWFVSAATDVVSVGVAVAAAVVAAAVGAAAAAAAGKEATGATAGDTPGDAREGGTATTGGGELKPPAGETATGVGMVRKAGMEWIGRFELQIYQREGTRERIGSIVTRMRLAYRHPLSVCVCSCVVRSGVVVCDGMCV